MEQVYLWIRAGGGAADGGDHISASMKRRAKLLRVSVERRREEMGSVKTDYWFNLGDAA